MVPLSYLPQPPARAPHTQVYRHHPPLVFGRSVADCEPEVSTGIAVYRAEGSAAAGGQPCFIAATFEQPHTSAQAVPRLLDFAQRYLGRAVG